MSSGVPPNTLKEEIRIKEANSGRISANPEVRIKQYFQQLTIGCSRSNCANIQCVSGGRAALTNDDAAAMALRLLIEKAPICSDEPDVAPPPGSSEQTIPSSVYAPDPILTLGYVKELIESCQKEYKDYKPLIRILGKIFSSSELLNSSFLLKQECIDENEPASIIGVNTSEVIEAYHLLFDLGEEIIENAIINGINALGNTVEIVLKSGRSNFKLSDLNQFVIVLLNPNLHSLEYLESALPNLLRAITALPIDLQCVLVKYWSKCSEENLRKLLDVFQQMVTVRILTGPHSATELPVNDDPAITNSVKCMKLVYYASIVAGQNEQVETYNYSNPDKTEVDDPMAEEVSLFGDALGGWAEEKDELSEKLGINIRQCRKPLIPYEYFINECLNEAIEMDRDYMYYKDGGVRFSFLNYSFVLGTATKSVGLFYDNRVRMYSERRMTILYGLMQGHVSSPYLKLRVRRDHLIQDALVRLEMVAQDQPEDFKKQFFVEFEGEQGVDEGGVSKEFFQLVIEELFNPDFGMFNFDETTRLCWFNPASFETENQFTLIGLLFGIAIYNSIILDVHFPSVLWRKLLGMRGVVEDLKKSHPIIYNGLQDLLTYDGDVEEDIGTTFEISYEVFGSVVNHELVKDGKNIKVNNHNREEYAARYADFLLNLSVHKQFEAFKRGFDIVTNDSIIKKLFRADELELLVCGTQEFNIHELEKATEYDGGYTKDKAVIRCGGDHHNVRNTLSSVLNSALNYRYFWEVVHSFTPDQLKQLLNFTTGSDRIPVGGIAKLKLIIARNGEDSDRLPTAHTCFNVMLLPEYSTKEQLRDRLLKAISYSKGFGLM